jgi:transcriptional regulator with XRE-family HTH domain
MEPTTDTPKRPHHGRNIKRIREFFGVKQEAFAKQLGPDWSQGRISVLEGRETIEPELIQQIAKTLNVSPQAIENITDEAVNNYFNNNFYDNSIQGANTNNNCILNFNPLEKLLEAISDNKILAEKNEKLYDQLLKVEREKNALLEKILDSTQKI